jgi:primosomal protein N' (replication factor Y)
MLLDNEVISVQDVSRFAGVSGSVVNTLEKYGYIKLWNMEVKRDPYKHRVFEKTYPLKPLEQQVFALNRVSQAMERGTFEEILLHGVTGSGKTEVYLQLIQKCFDMKKQAIVLVPEISLTPQMVERFKGRFGEQVAVIHSRLSMGERYDHWRLIKEGSIKVVVGARSAVFAPLENVGIIVIDEEHENSYKSEVTPKYHARDVARKRCMDENCVLLLGSATPSVETYYRAAAGQTVLIEMTKRTNDNPLPAVELIDMRMSLKTATGVFSAANYMKRFQGILKIVNKLYCL